MVYSLGYVRALNEDTVASRILIKVSREKVYSIRYRMKDHDHLLL